MTDYTDLIAHLRRYAEGCDPETVLEAAAAIAALTAERDALRGALGKLAAAGDDLMDEAKSLSRAASSDIYEPYRKAWEEARAAITAPTTGC